MNKILVSTVIFINEYKEILMEKRSSLTLKSTFWQFPGGKVESNEKLKEAAIREIKEELNITIKQSELHPFSFEDYVKNNTHFLIFYFICKKWEGNIVAQENQQIEWLKLKTDNIAKILPYNKLVFKELIKFV